MSEVSSARPPIPYRKVATCLWQDRRFRSLSAPGANAQTLWVYLLTGEHTDQVPGLSRAGEAGLAEALGWPLEAFRACWREIEAQGMAEADWSARVVWLPNAVRYNPPENPNVVKSWGRAWSAVPECELKDRARDVLEEHMRGRGETFLAAFAATCPPTIPKRSPKRSGKGCRQVPPNQEHEHEHEQEPEQEPEQDHQPGAPPARPVVATKAPSVDALKVALVAAYQELRGEKYRHSGAKDTQALNRLLADAEPAEIERRWRLALVASGFHRCDSFAQLAMQEKWARFGSSAPGLVTAPAAPAADFVPGPVNL